MKHDGALIGYGRCADIFAIDDRFALKLYHPRFRKEDVSAWAAAAETVAAAGVAAPRIHAVEEHDGRFGMVMDRIHGGTLFHRLLTDPDGAGELGAQIASLVSAIHAVRIEGLPARSPQMEQRIVALGDVAPNVKARTVEQLRKLSPGVGATHGDLHPGNIMVDADGRVIAIDWDGLRAGTVGHEIERTAGLLGSWALAPDAPEPERVGPLRPALVEGFRGASVWSDTDRSDARSWRLPVLVARIAENIDEERNVLDAQIAAELVN